MSAALNKLERAPPLHVSVQTSLKTYIRDNALQAGAPLPAESELARRLGVSRNSLREAVKSLESVGILETRRGIGVFVRDFSLEPLLEHLSYGMGSDRHAIADMLEIRRTLEVALIERAMDRLTEADLAELQAILGRMRACADRGEGFPDEDRAFHRLLFRGIENAAMLRLIDVFWLAFHGASRFFDMQNGDPVATWRDHAAILAAVVARDPAAARERLHRHYQDISDLLSERGLHAAAPAP